MNTFFPPADAPTKIPMTAAGVEPGRVHACDLVAAPPPTRSSGSGSGAVSVTLRWDPFAALLDLRDDYGDARCKAAKLVLTTATKPFFELINGKHWDEDPTSGVILVGLGFVRAFACSRIFQDDCVFEVAGVAGQDDRGAFSNRYEL